MSSNRKSKKTQMIFMIITFILLLSMILSVVVNVFTPIS
jgi:predicted nucleic acid-binding Zn ribbon protein